MGRKIRKRSQKATERERLERGGRETRGKDRGTIKKRERERERERAEREDRRPTKAGIE